ncbi:MAG: tRNA 2-selenouridine(34) synthase MnmH [Clostridiales bacterium]|nr:tRNA 2-selenouridine(34) synthase MnmH [Clostridiales bacterium]
MTIINIKEALELKSKIFIDVRSPKEFEESHIVGAINWPILDDVERDTVGKIYKALGKADAVKEGIDAVQGKLKDFFEKLQILTEDYDELILYCSRGGMRSDTLYNFGKSIGIKNLYKLNEGYKAYRNHVILESNDLLKVKPLIVIHGQTGVGKTKILNGLIAKNIPVIDLEDLAKNAGSVFGNVPYDESPPSQKMFENLVFEKLRTQKPYIFVESESKRIGTVSMTNEFYEFMEKGYHILIKTDLGNRVEIIKELYLPAFKSKKIIDSINHLRKRMGHEKVNHLIELVNNEEFDTVIEKLINEYYDPLYNFSIKKQKDYNLEIYYKDVDEAVTALETYYNEVSYDKE